MKVLERLILMQVVSPFKGTFDDVKLLNKLIDRISISEEEKEKLNLRLEGCNWVWDDDKEKGLKEVELKEVELTQDQVKLVKKALDQYKAGLEKEKNFTVAEVKKLDMIEAIIGENGVKEDGK